MELVKISGLSGACCHIFSVRMDAEAQTLFEEFLEENYDTYADEVLDIYNRLKFMGREGGAREQFFKTHEGAPGDLVCALYDRPDSNLRLYCIRFGTVAVVLGGGGYKPKNIRAWQQDPDLSKKAGLMKQISSSIRSAIERGSISITDDGIDGCLKLTDDYE